MSRVPRPEAAGGAPPKSAPTHPLPPRRAAREAASRGEPAFLPASTEHTLGLITTASLALRWFRVATSACHSQRLRATLHSTRQIGMHRRSATAIRCFVRVLRCSARGPPPCWPTRTLPNRLPPSCAGLLRPSLQSERRTGIRRRSATALRRFARVLRYPARSQKPPARSQSSLRYRLPPTCATLLPSLPPPPGDQNPPTGNRAFGPP